MKKVLIVMLVLLFASVVANADLRLYMNFEQVLENPGNPGTYDVVPDLSGYGNNGQFAASQWSTALPYQTTSHDGSQAMLFGYENGVAATYNDGPWNSIMIAKSNSIKDLGDKFTLATWVRNDKLGDFTGNYAYLMSNPNYGFQLNASGDPASYFWPYETSSWQFGMAPVDSYFQTWMHMAITWDGSTFKQYINGSQVFSKTNLPSFTTSNQWDNDQAWWFDDPMRLGSDVNAGNGRYLVGALDDVAVWGNAYLDQAGVQALYNGTETPLSVSYIPEPLTVVLLGLGSVALRKRK